MVVPSRSCSAQTAVMDGLINTMRSNEVVPQAIPHWRHTRGGTALKGTDRKGRPVHCTDAGLGRTPNEAQPKRERF